MIAFSFLIPDSLDSLKKKKKKERNCFWEAAEGAGKLRNWPPTENRKAVPLIKSSQLPTPSAALGTQLTREAVPLLAGAVGRRPGQTLLGSTRGPA